MIDQDMVSGTVEDLQTLTIEDQKTIAITLLAAIAEERGGRMALMSTTTTYGDHPLTVVVAFDGSAIWLHEAVNVLASQSPREIYRALWVRRPSLLKRVFNFLIRRVVN